MEVYANELSIEKNTFDDYTNIRNLTDVYKGMKENGICSCRVSNEILNDMIQNLNDDPQKRNVMNFIYAFFHAPYDSDENTPYYADEYLMHRWTYEGKECVGLAYSYIMDSLSLSFCAAKWKQSVDIKKDSEPVSVRNISEKSHLDVYKPWLERLKEVQLTKSPLDRNEKKIHLRDDHGKDKLFDFSKKLCECEYVTGVINSLPFNPKERNFIRRVCPNGIIECVLCWTDEGYGIAIQTTGRNLRETERIAEILKEEFCG